MRALRATRASDESLQSDESAGSLQSDESAQSETCKNERKRRLSIEKLHVKFHRGEKRTPQNHPLDWRAFFSSSKNGRCDWRTFFGACLFTLWEFTCKFAFEGRFFPRQNRPFRLKGVFSLVKNHPLDWREFFCSLKNALLKQNYM